MSNDTLLFELYTEEIPAFYQIEAINRWKSRLPALLEENLVEHSSVETGGTPRRLYALIHKASAQRLRRKNKLKGPPKDMCFKEGKRTPALEGFAKKAGINPDQVFFEENNGKEYAVAEVEEGGGDIRDVLPGIFESLLLEQKFPKTMRWGNSDIRYARPILSYYAQFGKDKLEFSGGLWNELSSSKALADLFYKFGELPPLDNASGYLEHLAAARIMADPSERREKITQLLEKEAGEGRAVIPEELLDEVNFLTESPGVVRCRFDEEFLELPDILILSEMQEHQRYFALRDKNGNLSNEFLVISNGERSEEAVSYIGSGNERVLRARLSDGAYFFKEDRKTPLAERIERLHGIVFQDKMGTMFDKKERLKKIASLFISSSGFAKDTEEQEVKRAGDLLKADLVSLLVYEFDHLQGEIGSIYAKLDGESENVCAAIREHYMPRNQADEYPQTPLGIVYSVADKADNILAGFVLKKTPKATQDPLGLRRQTLYLIEILIQNKIHLNFRTWVGGLLSLYGASDSLIEEVWDFVVGRMETIFEKEGFDKKLIQAGIRTGSDDLYEIYLKMSALSRIKEDKNFHLLMAGFKRMNNIVLDFQNKNPGETMQRPAENLFENGEEKVLYERARLLNQKLRENDGSVESYESVFQYLASIKDDVDRFFDSVMVMHEDIKIRNNRIGLLNETVSGVKQLIDVSLLQ